ncbi:MAG: insulinase family protein, partial [Gammaproteobacteria bacterium]
MFVVQRGAISVEKSPNDKRDYRALVLDNGMKVLLVSDASADRAAASVNVAAGSNSDPAAFRGLAHFLEHMLFLGTAKYPQSEEYQGFITSHGGSQNAFTAYENTNFYFEIDADYLEPALDRFSQFFIAPTFTAEYVNRERNAVNSEYQSGLQDDGRRSQAVMRAVLNPRHPMAGFSVGSLETLQ